MSATAGIQLSVQGSVAHVHIQQVGKFNAMSRAMWRELREVFQDGIEATRIRCVLIRGDGANFCAGGDISEYPTFRFEPALLHDFHERDVWGALRAMLDCDIPVVAQIEGYCVGAGLEIASCCDIRLASDTARFGAPIAHLGFPMAPREAELLLREVGAMTAREMLLSAAVLDAPTMLARGFLSRVVTEAEIAGTVSALTDKISQLAPQAARLNKQTLRALMSAAPQTQAWVESADASAAWHPAYGYAASAEHQEGISAFMQRRKPVFD